MVTTGRLSSFVGKGSKPMLLEKISGAETISTAGRPERLQFEAGSDRQQLILKHNRLELHKAQLWEEQHRIE